MNDRFSNELVFLLGMEIKALCLNHQWFYLLGTLYVDPEKDIVSFQLGTAGQDVHYLKVQLSGLLYSRPEGGWIYLSPLNNPPTAARLMTAMITDEALITPLVLTADELFANSIK